MPIKLIRSFKLKFSNHFPRCDEESIKSTRVRSVRDLHFLKLFSSQTFILFQISQRIFLKSQIQTQLIFTPICCILQHLVFSSLSFSPYLTRNLSAANLFCSPQHKCCSQKTLIMLDPTISVRCRERREARGITPSSGRHSSRHTGRTLV